MEVQPGQRLRCLYSQRHLRKTLGSHKVEGCPLTRRNQFLKDLLVCLALKDFTSRRKLPLARGVLAIVGKLTRNTMPR
eukprot:4409792-Amphidinium_carterae.1